MAAARQGLAVRLDRAPQRGAAFALTRASRRARTRSIGSRSRARGSSLIFDHRPAVAPPPSPGPLLITLSPATTACPPSVPFSPPAQPPHRPGPPEKYVTLLSPQALRSCESNPVLISRLFPFGSGHDNPRWRGVGFNGFYSRRQLLANAAIAASRVGS